MKDGPDHTPSFKSNVIVNGLSFDSHFPSSSSKLSQNEAAKLLSSTSLLHLQMCNVSTKASWRTLLTGKILNCHFTRAQLRDHLMLFASRLQSQEYHRTRVFLFWIRTTYLPSEMFAMSKRSTQYFSATMLTNESLKSDMQQNVKHGDESLLSSIIIHEEYSAESNEVVNLEETIAASLKIGPEDSMLSHSSVSYMQRICETAPTLFKEGSMSSDIATMESDSHLLSSNTNMGKPEAPESYLLCERVRMYPSYPNIDFPKGITVLPITDNIWVAVNLEFPNEQGH
ncbi:uncharacterized protein LOC8286582 [Ricinus communis]|uniref:DRBM domain-containing protein n=1 Tax=Ricinus communis TaxID=3988 RepID=B9RQ31_RICCO|nr:uncharacterized protein LOC8286582 [Ricinus communis]EEF46519.1 conserved hypothetical protein [Ricinus communis]